MKKNRILLLALLALLMSLVLAACGTAEPQIVEVTRISSEQIEVTRIVEGESITEMIEVTRVVEVEVPAEEPTEEPELTGTPKHIVWARPFFPTTAMDISTDDAFSLAEFGVLETLIRVQTDGQMVPWLAESWDQADDNTLVLTLRTDVTFQNGEAFNADAVVNALTLLLGAETPPRGFSPENFVSIEATGEFEVTMVTVEPDLLLPNRLVSASLGIMAPSAYIDGTTLTDPFGTGTGPFVMSEFVPEQSAEVVRNDSYWGGSVALDGATILLVLDGDVRSTMLQTGEADIIDFVPIPQIPLLEANPDVTLIKIPQPRTRTMYLNNSSGPMADVNVRRALLHAIDKQALVDTILEGVGEAAAGPFSSTEGWVNPDLTADTYDPELAIELLAEAGYGEDNPLSIRLWTYDSRAALPPMAIALQGMFRSVGVDSLIRIAQYGALSPEVLEGDFDIFIVSRGHALDSYDPEGFLSADFSCGGSFNLNIFCNETVDGMLAEARGLSDADARNELYRQIQQIVVDDEVASIFLNYTEQIWGHNNRVLNYLPHFLGHYTLTPEMDTK
jgi:peptide/nickel transport system substrate-binding protein